jgi:hypothetical protein
MKLKLSDLIELGSTMVYETHVSYLAARSVAKASWTGPPSGKCVLSVAPAGGEWCGCALGTAYVAATGIECTPGDLTPSAAQVYGFAMCNELRQMVISVPHLLCPEHLDGKCRPNGDHPMVTDSVSMVDHLHSRHMWPRQKIAEWLRPFEQAAEQKQAAEHMARTRFGEAERHSELQRRIVDSGDPEYSDRSDINVQMLRLGEKSAWSGSR